MWKEKAVATVLGTSVEDKRSEGGRETYEER
jgi:hypothetical protein